LLQTTARPKLAAWFNREESQMRRHLNPAIHLGIVFSAFLILLNGSPAAAEMYYEPAVITRIAVDSNNVAFIRLEPVSGASGPLTSAAGHAVATCSTHGYWQATFNVSTASGQAMLAVALSARLARLPVRVVGANGCPYHPQVEGIYVLDILPS
jgi:hypothetical protein